MTTECKTNKFIGNSIILKKHSWRDEMKDSSSLFLLLAGRVPLQANPRRPTPRRGAFQ